MNKFCYEDINNYTNEHNCSHAQAYLILEKKNVNFPHKPIGIEKSLPKGDVDDGWEKDLIK